MDPAFARATDVWSSFLNQPIEVAELRRRLAETIGRSGDVVVTD